MADNSNVLALVLSMVFISAIQLTGQSCANCNGSNTSVGDGAGTQGVSNSFFGKDAGAMNTGGANAFFGAFTGTKNEGSHNAFFGDFTGANNESGENNSFFGRSAGTSNKSGSYNSFFGYQAARENVNGSRNTFLGVQSGLENLSGNDNVFVGMTSGEKNIAGSDNVFIGRSAGNGNVSGGQHTYIGAQAGAKIVGGSRNICIGGSSGPSSSQSFSDRLYIDVVSGDFPLIYGEFDNDYVKINGSFEATGVANGSSRSYKQDFSSVDPAEILDKLSNLELREWSYKNLPDQRHLGPIAEDFYEAFGLGKDEKSISTIDANGVALVAIQALKKENEELKKLVNMLVESVDKLKDAK